MKLHARRSEVPSHLLKYFKPIGYKPKDLINIPSLFAEAMRQRGWYFRSLAPWVKVNGMPQSVKDRPGSATEYWMLFTKSEQYFYDTVATKKKAVNPDKVRSDMIGGGKYGEQRGQGHEGAFVDRYRRDADWWFESVEDVRLGMLADAEGLPLGFDFTVGGGFSGQHFAAMTVHMMEPIVQASTSEKGCCPTCGAQWVRVVEKERKATRPGVDSKVYQPNDSKQDQSGLRTYVGFNARWKAQNEVGNRDPQRHVTDIKTVGWEPGCGCPESEPVPSIIYDPFSGAASTAIAALMQGRRYAGTEVNRAYVELSIERIKQWRRQMAGLVEPEPKGPTLFDGLEVA